MVKAETEYKVETLKIKYNGFFNFGELVKFFKSWLKKNYYIVVEKKHKFEPSEQEVEFLGFRKPNDYVIYSIEVNAKTEDVKEVEIIKEGKKLNMQQGKLLITFNGKMKLDWQKRFKNHKFLTLLQDFYHKYIIREKIEDEWFDSFEKKYFEFRAEVKKIIFRGNNE